MPLTNEELRSHVKEFLSKCSPEGDQYIIIPDKRRTQTAGFYHADDGRMERREMEGEIVAKGIGRLLEGARGRQEMQFEVGQRVCFRQQAGVDLYYDENLQKHPSHEEERDDLILVKVIRQEALLYSLP